MATTFNFRPERGQGPLYRQLASYFRQEIREGRLLPLEFLPSIRKLNRDLKLSRTTAEAAYEILIDEGYVQNLPSRGYQVVDTGRIPAPKKVRPQWARAEKEKKRLLCSIIFPIITLIRPPSIRCCGALPEQGAA